MRLRVARLVFTLLVAACNGPQPAMPPSPAAPSTAPITPRVDTSPAVRSPFDAQRIDASPTLPPTPAVPELASPTVDPSPIDAAPATPLPIAAEPPVQPARAGRPVVCQTGGAEVYLVDGGGRRHIVDWETFLNLGFRQADIVACGGTASYPEEEPLTRLLKGSGEPVYWMQDGTRRHIPDMDTFRALGYRDADIAVVPDALLESWPLGEPLPQIRAAAPAAQPSPPGPTVEAAATPGDVLFHEATVGAYTVRLWHPAQGRGMYDHATISTPGQPELRVENATAIAASPAPDITGEGDPDVVFETYDGGSSHCCWGTVIYNLGREPRKVLEMRSSAYWTGGTGRGSLEDLDGDGRYEFLSHDPLKGIECSQAAVKVVLQYDPAAGRYVGAGPRFKAAYADDIARHTQAAEAQVEATRTGYKCGVYEVVMDYLYSGQDGRAREELGRLYLGSDVEEFWAQLVAAAHGGRYYVAPATP